MSQVLRPYVLMAAWAAVAWSFAPPAADAQTPYHEPRGVGEHLLFAYWSVEDDTNTNVAVHVPRGVRSMASEEKPSVAQLVVRDRMGKIATEFKICLMPGEAWTATLTAAGLRVGDPGECDERIHQGGGTRTGKLVVTPKQGEVVTLGTATSGWLDVWLTPAKALKDGPDEDTEPDHANANFFLDGEATLVSPGAGFASSYDAVALRSCGDWVNILGDSWFDSETGQKGYRAWSIAPTYPDRTPNDATDDRVDTGDGCWTMDKDGNGVVGEEKTGSSALWDEIDPVSQGLRVGPPSYFAARNTLVGRWTALSDANVQTHTKVVLTFPQTPLRYEGKNAEGVKVMGTDPVSVLVFDTEGGVALDSREVELAQDVNVCTFLPAGSEAAPGLLPGLSCNGKLVGALQGTSGGFRFFNHTAVTLDGAGTVTNAGTEASGFGIKQPTAGDGSNAARPAGGQVPDAKYRFPVVGLVFSYFRGTDGAAYDQVKPLKGDWRPVTADPAGTDEGDRKDNPYL